MRVTVGTIPANIPPETFCRLTKKFASWKATDPIVRGNTNNNQLGFFY